MNCHEGIEVVCNTNIGLVKKLIASLERTGKNPHILFPLSSQEELDNLYGQSKKEGRELLAAWAQKARANFTGLIIPNIFGAFAKPMYNSVVATFSHLIANGGVPKIDIHREMKLIYVGEVISKFINKIRAKTNKNYCSMPHMLKLRFWKC